MTTHYVYRKSEGEQLWTVGFYAPDGEWMPERDCDTPKEAGEVVAYLNGGEKPKAIRVPGMTYAEGIAAVKAKWPKRYFSIEAASYQRTGEDTVEILFAGRVSKEGSGNGWERYMSNSASFAEVIACLLAEGDAPNLGEKIIEGSVEC